MRADFPFFNVNGVIGKGAYEKPDFPTVSSFVEHMDYLGIARSLVWSVAARDQNPAIGNRQLLEDIDAAGLRDRLLPAFIVTPACFFEKGVMEFLQQQLSSGAVRALRLTPETSRYPIRQIERVLHALAPFKPLVLWDCLSGGEQDFRDFENLARQFHQLFFAATQKMWPGFGAVMDLMWRCPNVCVDISWLHMRGTIELLTEQFGAQRVLFGIGYKSHYGASIAALAHARINNIQRAAIAYENLERLLNMSPYKGPASSLPELLNAKALWHANRRGHALRNVEIIDAHGHTPPHTRGWIIRTNTVEDGMADVLERMDRLGIDRLILSPESALFGENLANNRHAEQALKGFYKRVSGYLVFNPLYGEEMKPRLDEFFGRKFFVGFKLLPAYWKIPVTDSGYIPVWEYANRFRLPILIHTWEGSTCSPAMLTDIVKRFPDAFYLLGHSGGGTKGRLEAEALAQSSANVYLEFCGSFTTPRPFEQSLRIAGSDRVIFGTDASAHDPAWELGRYLSLPLPDSELIPGLAANIKRILAARKN